MRVKEAAIKALGASSHQGGYTACAPDWDFPGDLYCGCGNSNPRGDMQVRFLCSSRSIQLLSLIRYNHRPINVRKLVDIKFTYVQRNMTLARMMRLHKLPSTPRLANLREMTEKDIPQVHALYTRYMQRFSMAPDMTHSEIKHYLLSGLGEGDPPGKWQGRREKQVVWAYVIEVISFQSLNRTAINPVCLYVEPSNTQNNRFLLVLLVAVDNHAESNT